MKFVFVLLLIASAVSAYPNLGHKEPEVVGGMDAAPGQFPYQVAVNYLELTKYLFTCGGSIYNENTIVTACHCVHNREDKTYQIVASNIERKSPDAQVIQVKKVIPHPDYSGIMVNNDVALLILERPLVLDNFTGPIDLESEYTDPGTLCTVSGWGRIVEDGDLPDTLQYVDLPVISDAECAEDYRNRTIIDDDMICALADGEEPQDACNGDSGGPFTCNGNLVGIVSWGRGCAREGYPGVYTEVRRYKQWIEDNAV